MRAVVLVFSLAGSVHAQQPQPRVSPNQTPVMVKPAAPIAWVPVVETYPLAQPQQAYAIPLYKANPPGPLGFLAWTSEGGWHWRLKTSWTQVDFPPQARGVRSASQVLANKSLCGMSGCMKWPVAWQQSYYVAFPAGAMTAPTARAMTQTAAPVSLTPLAMIVTDARAAAVSAPTGTIVRESEATPPYAGSWATLTAGQQLQLDGGGRVLMLEGSNLVLRTSAGALVAEFPANANVVRLPDYRVEVWTFVGSKVLASPGWP